jgi:hypothetical protein
MPAALCATSSIGSAGTKSDQTCGTTMAEPQTVAVYIDYKSPYAYLAKDLVYELERDFPVQGFRIIRRVRGVQSWTASAVPPRRSAFSACRPLYLPAKYSGAASTCPKSARCSSPLMSSPRLRARPELIQRSSVGYSSFPRKREFRGSKISAAAPCSSQSLPLAKAGGQALDPRFRGGDDTLLITLASFQVRHLAQAPIARSARNRTDRQWRQP